jgi:glycosyltransferase involved in cell wall biosynthesis
MRTNDSRSTIALILPVYNESEVIDAVLSSLPKELAVGKHTYRVLTIVVNDGSTDTTASIVLKHKGVYLINHVLNAGAGAATRTGLTYARQIKAMAAVTMDADGQHDVQDVIKVMRATVRDEGDLVIGSRLVDSRGMPWYKVWGNKGISVVTFVIFGVFVTDSQSGLKGFNEKALENISFHSNNFAFCSEIVWRAKQTRLRIKEIPIKAIYTDYTRSKGQSRSTVHRNTSGLRIIQQLLRRRFLEFING